MKYRTRETMPASKLDYSAFTTETVAIKHAPALKASVCASQAGNSELFSTSALILPIYFAEASGNGRGSAA